MSKQKRKSKHKQPSLSLWDRVLFSKSFSFRTEVDVDYIFNYLDKFEGKEGGNFSRWRYEIGYGPISKKDQIYAFDVTLERGGQTNQSFTTSAIASGTISFNEITEQTIIEGKCKLGMFNFIGLIFLGGAWSVMTYLSTTIGSVNVAGGLYLCGMLFLFLMMLFVLGWQLFDDRNQLLDDLRAISYVRKPR